MLIMFVCYGNSCRSPMAESIFNTKMAGTEHIAKSCGLNPADIIQTGTIQVLTEGGFDTSDLKPELVTDEKLAEADRIIAMDNWVAEQLLGFDVEAWEISDPYRKDISEYKRTRDSLIESIDMLIESIK